MNIPGADEPLQPLEGVVRRRVCAGRVAPALERDGDRRLAVRCSVRSATPDSPTATPTPDLPRRERTGGQLRVGRAAGSEDPLVAACRHQLGRARRFTHANSRRHRHLHRPAGLCLDLEPDRQHRRAHRIRADRQPRTRDRSIPIPTATSRRHRRPARRSAYELALTDADFKFPQIWRSNIAVDQRLPGDITGDRRVPLQQGRQRHLLHQRQPAGGADGVRRRGQPAALDRTTASTQHIIERHRAEEPGRRVVVELSPRRYRSGPRSAFAFEGAYSYGMSENTVDAGSIAFGSWAGNPHSGDPNNPGRISVRSFGRHRVYVLSVLHPRVLQLRGNDRLGVLGGAQQRQHELRVRRRHERRRRVEQRPDLHPARYRRR